MSNHIHLLAVPERHDSLHRALGRTHADYARYLNIKRGSCGHLWQARFFSCVVAPEHLWITMAYIERNPVRAGLSLRADQYHWSSAASHTTGIDAEHLIDMRRRRMEYTPRRWEQVLRSTVEAEAEAERIREATLRGRPLGGAQFLSDL
jgi:putative transposase